MQGGDAQPESPSSTPNSSPSSTPSSSPASTDTESDHEDSDPTKPFKFYGKKTAYKQKGLQFFWPDTPYRYLNFEKK